MAFSASALIVTVIIYSCVLSVAFLSKDTRLQMTSDIVLINSVILMFVLMLKGGRIPQLINQSTDSTMYTKLLSKSVPPLLCVSSYHRDLRQFKTGILSMRSIRNEP